MKYFLVSGGLDSSTMYKEFYKKGDTAVFINYQQESLTQELKNVKHLTNDDFLYLEVKKPNKLNDFYYQGRNLLFLSLVLSKTQEGDEIYIGVSATDYDEFPDCRPYFFKTLNLAFSTYKVSVKTPYVFTERKEIYKKAKEFKLNYTSCYSPTKNGLPCGVCLSCIVDMDNR